jgi:hypothetical protein
MRIDVVYGKKARAVCATGLICLLGCGEDEPSTATSTAQQATTSVEPPESAEVVLEVSSDGCAVVRLLGDPTELSPYCVENSRRFPLQVARIPTPTAVYRLMLLGEYQLSSVAVSGAELLGNERGWLLLQTDPEAEWAIEVLGPGDQPVSCSYERIVAECS